MQKITEIERRFTALDENEKSANYNFDHFKPSILIHDLKRTVKAQGIGAGELAPDFELPEVDGAIRLSDLRGKPLILHFGSYS